MPHFKIFYEPDTLLTDVLNKVKRFTPPERPYCPADIPTSLDVLKIAWVDGQLVFECMDIPKDIQGQPRHAGFRVVRDPVCIDGQ